MMEKTKITLVLAILVLSFAVGANAEIIASYDYFNSAGADPTAQGWTLVAKDSTGGTPSVGSYDAGVVWPNATEPDGWRIIDASSYNNYTFYTAGISNVDALYDSWEMSWTFSMDGSAWGKDGTSSYLGYYLPGGPASQTFNGLIVNTKGENGYTYRIELRADSEGNLVIFDGSASHVLTSGGNNNAFDTLYTISVAYDGTDAVMSFGGNAFTLTDQGASTIDRVLFGDFSGNPQNSVVYQEVEMSTVPEPATMAILGLGGLLVCRRRRS